MSPAIPPSPQASNGNSSPTAAPHPDATTKPRRPWASWPTIRRIALVLLGGAAVGVAIAGFATEGPLFLIAAWVYASLPIVYLIARAFRERQAARRLMGAVPAALLAAALGAVTFAVVTSCTQRLGPGADLSECDLSGENLAAQDLRRANLREADLRGANLRNTILSGANLAGADLRDARLPGTNLGGANLARADLRGLDLTTAGLDGVDFSQALLDRANLRATNLAQARLRGASLNNARAERASMERADLSGANLEAAVLTEADLQRVVLRGANMRKATFEDADLTGADLTDAVLEEASLDRASLVDSKGLSDDALATVLGVDTAQLGRALIERDIRLESRESILRTLGRACRGGTVSGAARHRQGSIRPMIIVDGAGHSSSLSKQAANRGWEPMAVRFGQLVACVHEEERVEIQNCAYNLEGGGFASITRYQHRRRVRVVAARSGSEVFEQTYQGTMPEACPVFETFSSAALHETREGSNIGFGTIQAKLESLVK